MKTVAVLLVAAVLFVNTVKIGVGTFLEAQKADIDHIQAMQLQSAR